MQKNAGEYVIDLKYFILLRPIINQQNSLKMKKLSIVAALLFAFGTVTFAQDAAKTPSKKAAPAKTEKKATEKKSMKKMEKKGGSKTEKKASDKK